jgi:hypothetical protein
MLFLLEKDKTVLESNPQFKIFEEFGDCTDRELRYIALVYDYDTPLRSLPLKERKEYAADMSGYKREPGGRLDKNARTALGGGLPKVQKAIAKYNSLQYDQEKELLNALSVQINQVIDLMKKEDKEDSDWDLIKKLTPELPKMISQKKELEVVIGYREPDQKDELDDEPLSALDLFHLEKL